MAGSLGRRVHRAGACSSCPPPSSLHHFHAHGRAAMQRHSPGPKGSPPAMMSSIMRLACRDEQAGRATVRESNSQHSSQGEQQSAQQLCMLCDGIAAPVGTARSSEVHTQLTPGGRQSQPPKQAAHLVRAGWLARHGDPAGVGALVNLDGGACRWVGRCCKRSGASSVAAADLQSQQRLAPTSPQLVSARAPCPPS